VQLPRTSTNIDSLGVLGNNPVLAGDIPVADITAGDVGVEGSALSGLDAQAVEASELDLGVLGPTKRNVALHNLVTANLAGVGDGSLDSVEHVPKLGVATWRTTSRNARLRRAVSSLGRPGVVDTVLGILRCFGKVGRVEVGEDVGSGPRRVGRELVLFNVRAVVAQRRCGNGLSSRGGVGTGRHLGDLDVRVVKRRV